MDGGGGEYYKVLEEMGTAGEYNGTRGRQPMGLVFFKR